MKKAVVYQPDEGKFFLLSGLFRGQEIEVIRIGRKDADTKLSALFGLTARTKEEAKEKAPLLYELPALTVLFGLRSEELDAFLSEKKRLGIRNTGLLSIATPTNISWTPYELSKELLLEQQEIERQLKK